MHIFFLTFLIGASTSAQCAPKWSASMASTYSIGTLVCYENAETSLHDNYYCFDTTQCKNPLAVPGAYQAWSDKGLCDSDCRLPTCRLDVTVTGHGSYQVPVPECTIQTTLVATADTGNVVSMIVVDGNTVFDGRQEQVSVQVTPMPDTKVSLEFVTATCPVLVTFSEGGTYTLDPPEQKCGTQASLQVTASELHHISRITENGESIFQSAEATGACVSVNAGSNIHIEFALNVCPVHVDIMGGVGGTYTMDPTEPLCGLSTTLTAQASSGCYVCQIRDDDQVVFTSTQDLSASVLVASGSNVILEFHRLECKLDIRITGAGSYYVSPRPILCGDMVTLELKADMGHYIYAFEGSGQSYHGENCADSQVKAVDVHNFMGASMTLEFRPRALVTVTTSTGVTATPASGPCGYTTKIDLDAIEARTALDSFVENGVEIIKYHKHIHQQRRTYDLPIKMSKTYTRTVKPFTTGLIEIKLSSSVENGVIFVTDFGVVGQEPNDSNVLDLPTSVWQPQMKDAYSTPSALHFQGWHGANKLRLCDDSTEVPFDNGYAYVYLSVWLTAVPTCHVTYDADGNYVYEAVLTIS
jgi:hypothetical protein